MIFARRGLLALALVVALGPSPGRAQADVTLRDLRFQAGPLSYTIPVATFRGTSLSAAEIAAALDPAGATPLGERLGRLEAREVAIPELVSEMTLPSGRQTTTYRDVVATGLAGGRVATIAATGGAITTSGRDGAAGGGTFGRVAIDDTDLGATVELMTGRPSAPESPLRKLYAGFAMENLALTDPKGGTTSIERLAGRDLAARPTREGWLDILALMSRERDLDTATPDVRRRVFDGMIDLFEAVSIGSVEATGLDFAPKPGDDGRGRIGRIAFTGGSAGHAAELRLEKLDLRSPDGAFRLADLSFSGLSMKPMLEAARDLAGAKPGQVAPSDLRRLFPLVGTVRMSELEADVPAEPGKPGERLRFSLGAFEVAAERPVAAVPSELRIAVRRLAFAVPPGSSNDLLRQLAGLGYDRFDLSIGAGLGWDEGSREIRLRDLSMEGADMGSATLRGVIGGISKDAFDPDTAVASVALLDAALKSLELVVEDRGLAERILARAARASGRTPEDVRREYAMMAAIGIPAMLGPSPAARALSQAVGRFVARPGRLRVQVRAKASNGFGAADFAAGPDPASVLEQIEISATAE